MGFHSIFLGFGFQDYKPTYNPSSHSCFQRKKNTVKRSYPISGQFSKQKEKQRRELLTPQALPRPGLPPAPGRAAPSSGERESTFPTFARAGCGGRRRKVFKDKMGVSEELATWGFIQIILQMVLFGNSIAGKEPGRPALGAHAGPAPRPRRAEDGRHSALHLRLGSHSFLFVCLQNSLRLMT